MGHTDHTAQNVVAMSDHRTHVGYGPLAQVEAYWESLRGSRLMPRRSDIDPRGIESALEYAFILERVAVGVARLRIAGGHLRDLMGMEVSGMPITAFFATQSRPRVSEVLEEVFQMPGQTNLHLIAPAAHGRPALAGRMLLLPLESDLGDVSRVLGCLVVQGDIGQSPRRFDLTQEKRHSVLGGATRPLRYAAPFQQPSLPRETGFAEGKACFTPATTGDIPPYLRLVKSKQE
ncbi:MAG: PAS domain-containing protein [Sulfitobacter pontiacus]|uniref:PAS domain-containing protein n=1 Tax=Sulfitobacter pontiacus TaxID=60137 RepID=UPI0032992A39